MIKLVGVRHSMIALVLLTCLNGTCVGPVVRLIGMRVGLVSAGCSSWWQSSEIFFHVQCR
jgi:hypothetical protein